MLVSINIACPIADPSPVHAAEPLLLSEIDNSSRQPESSSASLENQIRTFDRQIFLKLVQLAMYNVRYQQNINHYARWRKWFYPVAQESAYGCLLAFSVSDLSQRARGWKDPSKVSPTSTKQAIEGAMVGSLIGGTSSMIELAANGAEAVRVRRSEFSATKSMSTVQSALNFIDEKLARRHALMLQIDQRSPGRELVELKEELLRYERDRLAFEFKRWNAHSRGLVWNKNTFYLINSAVNFSRFSAATLALKSFTAPGASGGIGPVLTVAASLAGLGPAASSAVGNCIKKHQQNKLDKELPSAPPLPPAQIKVKFERLNTLLESDEANTDKQRLAKELIHLREEKLALDTLIFAEERNIERSRLVAGQQALVAPPISSMGLASAILSTVGYHGFRNQPIINNKLSYAGDACAIPAESIALIATPAAAMRTYLYEKNLRKKNEHPEQLLSKRLKDLQELEVMVTEAWQ